MRMKEKTKMAKPPLLLFPSNIKGVTSNRRRNTQRQQFRGYACLGPEGVQLTFSQVRVAPGPM
jgi:hypothetical protein